MVSHKSVTRASARAGQVPSCSCPSVPSHLVWSASPSFHEPHSLRRSVSNRQSSITRLPHAQAPRPSPDSRRHFEPNREEDHWDETQLPALLFRFGYSRNKNGVNCSRAWQSVGECLPLWVLMDDGPASGLSQTGNYLRVRHSIVISSSLSHLAPATQLWACCGRAAERVTLYSGVRAVLLDFFCYRGVYSALSEPEAPANRTQSLVLVS